MLTRPMDVLTAFPVRKSKQQKHVGESLTNARLTKPEKRA